MPERIQLRRTKGWRLPPNTVVVSRPSRYGNPHRIGYCPECGAEHTREEAVAEFRAEIAEADILGRVRRELAGKNLACWCPLPKPGEPDICHAAVLLEIANQPVTS